EKLKSLLPEIGIFEDSEIERWIRDGEDPPEEIKNIGTAIAQVIGEIADDLGDDEEPPARRGPRTTTAYIGRKLDEEILPTEENLSRRGLTLAKLKAAITIPHQFDRISKELANLRREREIRNLGRLSKPPGSPDWRMDLIQDKPRLLFPSSSRRQEVLAEISSKRAEIWKNMKHEGLIFPCLRLPKGSTRRFPNPDQTESQQDELLLAWLHRRLISEGETGLPPIQQPETLLLECTLRVPEGGLFDLVYKAATRKKVSLPTETPQRYLSYLQAISMLDALDEETKQQILREILGDKFPENMLPDWEITLRPPLANLQPGTIDNRPEGGKILLIQDLLYQADDGRLCMLAAVPIPGEGQTERPRFHYLMPANPGRRVKAEAENGPSLVTLLAIRRKKRRKAYPSPEYF
ncbi:MAG: hypothetical protein Q8P95_04265, partial [bacterium]|nr:hypothetical protein [bacterium]